MRTRSRPASVHRLAMIEAEGARRARPAVCVDRWNPLLLPRRTSLLRTRIPRRRQISDPDQQGLAGGPLRRRPSACATRSTAKFVALQPCVVCGRTPSEAHHIRFAQPRALGRKVSDEYTIPLCRLHHRELHRYGDEASWWAGVSIDPLPIALDLWKRSHPGCVN